MEAVAQSPRVRRRVQVVPRSVVAVEPPNGPEVHAACRDERHQRQAQHHLALLAASAAPRSHSPRRGPSGHGSCHESSSTGETSATPAGAITSPAGYIYTYTWRHSRSI